MEFQTLNLDSDECPDDIDPSDPAPTGFWDRQFQQVATPRQRVFDWAYGVVIPLICVVADPIVFDHGGILGPYRPFAYVLSAVSILTMVAWLLWGERIGWLAAPIAGLFVAGSFVSLVVGIAILPFSLLGLLILIGFLGFTPLFSSLVYLRNGVRAFRAAKTFLDGTTVVRAALLAALVSVVVPYVVKVQVSRIVQEIVTGDVDTIDRGSAKLKYIRPLVDAGPIAERYYRHANNNEKNSPRAKALVRAYRELSDGDVYGPPEGE